ncbi:hypothetical protein QL285_082811 [Trifolium repens]|nr:hypothetical protein QL285_082811 [Trifolium repens]
MEQDQVLRETFSHFVVLRKFTKLHSSSLLAVAFFPPFHLEKISIPSPKHLILSLLESLELRDSSPKVTNLFLSIVWQRLMEFS